MALLSALLLLFVAASESRNLERISTEYVYIAPEGEQSKRNSELFEARYEAMTYRLSTSFGYVIESSCMITLPCSEEAYLAFLEDSEVKQEYCSTGWYQTKTYISSGAAVTVKLYSGRYDSPNYDCTFKSILPPPPTTVPPTTTPPPTTTTLRPTTTKKPPTTTKPPPTTTTPPPTTTTPPPTTTTQPPTTTTQPPTTTTQPPTTTKPTTTTKAPSTTTKPVTTTAAPIGKNPDYEMKKTLKDGETWRMKMVSDFVEKEQYLVKYELSTTESCGLIAKCSLVMPCDDVPMAVITSPGSKIRSYYCGKNNDPFTITQTSAGQDMTIYLHSGYASSPSYDCKVQTRSECPDETTTTTSTTTEKPKPVGCQCGENNVNRIINGSPAPKGEIPWQVAVQSGGEMDTWNTFCGATLVSDRHVITAAHCLAPNEAQTHRLQMGITDLKEAGVVFKIKKVVPFDRFPQIANDGDISILFIEGYVDFSKNVFPACLPPKNSKEAFVGQTMTVSGWGRTQSGEKSEALLKTSVKVIAQEDCKKKMGEDKITDNMMCAVGDDTDACQGDSGGPLTFRDKNGINFLTGVVSWGEGCNDKKYAGVYVRVTKFIDWFNEETENKVCTRYMRV